MSVPLRHHFDLPIETPPTSFPDSSSPIVGVAPLLRLFAESDFFLRGTSTPPEPFLSPSRVICRSIFLFSCVSSFWYDSTNGSPLLCNLLVAILAYSSSPSPFPPRCSTKFLHFVPVVSFTFLCVFLFHLLKLLAFSVDTFVSCSPRSICKKKRGIRVSSS